MEKEFVNRMLEAADNPRTKEIYQDYHKKYDRLFNDRPEIKQDELVSNMDHYFDEVEVNGPIIIRGEDDCKDIVLISMDDYKLFSNDSSNSI